MSPDMPPEALLNSMVPLAGTSASHFLPFPSPTFTKPSRGPLAVTVQDF